MPEMIVAECQVPKCHKLAQRACIDSHDYTECAMALGYCTEMLEGTFFNAGVNP
jgi:cathepsin A (carboxypeptidase C)